VKIVAFKEKHKLADKWEQEPYKVLGQHNPDIPVSGSSESENEIFTGCSSRVSSSDFSVEVLLHVTSESVSLASISS
jgi:hypothetical protein